MYKKDLIIIKELNTSSDLFGVEKNVFEKILQQEHSLVSINRLERMDYIHKDYYGGRGQKLVIKAYFNDGNKDKETLFFMKQHCQKNPNEALNFKYLTQFNAPIPQLYAYYSNKGQQDIIITEVVKPFYVDDDPQFMLNKDILKPFIEVTARFNAVTINDEYKNIIANRYDLLNNQIRPYHNQLIELFDTIKTDPIYYNLKNKITKTVENKILELHKMICENIETMEKGLYHWDHKPRNMGWSDVQQKHVIFDLEDTLWGPRFYNIGMWLGGNDQLEQKYAPSEELAKMYLNIYNEASNQNISVDCLLHESFPLWVAYKIEMLLCSFGEAGTDPYFLRNREPNEYKKEMEGKFVHYLNLLCSL